MLDVAQEAYVAAIIEAASRDTSIARVLREICGLAGDVRAGALDLVGAQLRTSGGRGAPPDSPQSGARLDDVLQCLDALKRDEIARSIAERLGPPG